MKVASTDRFTITATFDNGVKRSAANLHGLDCLAKLIEYRKAGAKSVKYQRDSDINARR